MDGYIVNKSGMWRHVFKRAVGPNQSVSLDDLYKEYGIKNNINEGKEFIDWLKEIKLKNDNRWLFNYNETEYTKDNKKVTDSGVVIEVVDGVETIADIPNDDDKLDNSVDEVKNNSNNKRSKLTKEDLVTPMTSIRMTPERLINLKLPEFKEQLEKTNDLNVVKKAINLCRRNSKGKKTITKMLIEKKEILESYGRR